MIIFSIFDEFAHIFYLANITSCILPLTSCTPGLDYILSLRIWWVCAYFWSCKYLAYSPLTSYLHSRFRVARVGVAWSTATLYERAGSSPKGRTPNISYFVAKHSTKLLSQKLANTRSSKGLRVFVALFESQLTPATLSWFCSAKSRIAYKKRVIVIVQSNMCIYL